MSHIELRTSTTERIPIAVTYGRRRAEGDLCQYCAFDGGKWVHAGPLATASSSTPGLSAPSALPEIASSVSQSNGSGLWEHAPPTTLPHLTSSSAIVTADTYEQQASVNTGGHASAPTAIIVGATVGTLCFLTVTIALMFVYLRRRRKSVSPNRRLSLDLLATPIDQNAPKNRVSSFLAHGRLVLSPKSPTPRCNLPTSPVPFRKNDEVDGSKKPMVPLYHGGGQQLFLSWDSDRGSVSEFSVHS